MTEARDEPSQTSASVPATRVRDQLDDGTTKVGSQLRSLAEALRRSGEELAREGNGGAAQLTRQVARQINRFGGYLEETSTDELARDLQIFARRRWALAAAGSLVGMAAARFVNTPSTTREADDRPPSQPQPSLPPLLPPESDGLGGR